LLTPWWFRSATVGGCQIARSAVVQRTRAFAQNSDRGVGCERQCFKSRPPTDRRKLLRAVRIDGGNRARTFWVRNGIIVAALKSENHAHAGLDRKLGHAFSTSHQDESGPSSLSCRLPGVRPCSPPTHGVINLYLAAQGFPSRIHHRSAEFVKHHPRGLVTRQTRVGAARSRAGTPTLVRGHQIRRPEPNGSAESSCGEEWVPRCQRNLVPTLGAW